MTTGTTRRSTLPAALDHIVWATPQLRSTVEEFTERTGVRPAVGGVHPGFGTRNHLVSLGGAAYLEIVGPDPEGPEPQRPRPFGIDRITEPTVATWVLRPADLDAAVARARARGYDPGAIRPMSRSTADGTLLSWRLTDLDALHPSGLVPFLIDWGGTPHPTESDLPRLTLTGLTLRAPVPEDITGPLAALDTPVEVSTGPRRLSFTVDTPKGPVTFS